MVEFPMVWMVLVEYPYDHSKAARVEVFADEHNAELGLLMILRNLYGDRHSPLAELRDRYAQDFATGKIPGDAIITITDIPVQKWEN